MGFAHLLKTKVALANFRAKFAIPPDVDVAYYHEENIALEPRKSGVLPFNVCFRGRGEVPCRSFDT